MEMANDPVSGIGHHRENNCHVGEGELRLIYFIQLMLYRLQPKLRSTALSSPSSVARMMMLQLRQPTLGRPGLPNTLKTADRIHRFPAKMSPGLAHSFLESVARQYARTCRLRFHDPMCGSSTTALVARTLGFAVSASDILFPACVISTAKLYRLSDYSLKDLVDFSNSIEVSGNPRPRKLWPNWPIWYTPTVLRSLEDVVETIFRIQRKAFFTHMLTAFFQTAWDVSAADKKVMVPTHSRYSKAPPRLSPGHVLVLLRQRLGRILRAQDTLRQLGFSSEKPEVRQADVLENRGWPSDRLDIVFSSPPYGCGIDYERAFRLQMRFAGPFLSHSCPNSRLVGRHTNIEANLDSLPSRERRSEWCVRVSKADPTRFRMFLQYLQDFRSFLRITHDHLSRNGRLCLVIGNPQIARNPVPLARIVQELGEEEGFRLATSPKRDWIKCRMQQFELRSATSHISQEFLLSFLPV